MRRDVEPLALTSALLQVKCFFPIVFGEVHFTEVAVRRAQSGICHGKIRIQFNGSLIERSGPNFVGCGECFTSPKVNDFSASSEEVVACSSGFSNFWMEAS